MAPHQQQQPHLNGAYYGPPIPSKQSHRPGRSSGRGCCCLFDCLFDCGCCLLGCVFKIIFSILLTIGILILLLWLIIHPSYPKFHASDASLSTFNYTDSRLTYNLAVNFTLRNPNRHIGIYYDSVEVNAFYQGQRFDTKIVDPFFQGTKNTTEVGPIGFNGITAFNLGSTSDYESEKGKGVYEIVVRMHLRVRYKLGAFKTGKWKPKVKCDISVPLGSSTATFTPTKCRYYY